MRQFHRIYFQILSRQCLRLKLISVTNFITSYKEVTTDIIKYHFQAISEIQRSLQENILAKLGVLMVCIVLIIRTSETINHAQQSRPMTETLGNCNSAKRDNLPAAVGVPEEKIVTQKSLSLL